MMSVRFIHVDKLTIHCFNISRVGVGRRDWPILELLLLFKNRTAISVRLVVCSLVPGVLLPICPFGMIRRFGRYSWEGGLVNLIRERCTS